MSTTINTSIYDCDRTEQNDESGIYDGLPEHCWHRPSGPDPSETDPWTPRWERYEARAEGETYLEGCMLVTHTGQRLDPSDKTGSSDDRDDYGNVTDGGPENWDEVESRAKRQRENEKESQAANVLETREHVRGQFRIADAPPGERGRWRRLQQVDYEYGACGWDRAEAEIDYDKDQHLRLAILLCELMHLDEHIRTRILKLVLEQDATKKFNSWYAGVEGAVVAWAALLQYDSAEEALESVRAPLMENAYNDAGRGSFEQLIQYAFGDYWEDYGKDLIG